jgi:hypothetical protein
MYKRLVDTNKITLDFFEKTLQWNSALFKCKHSFECQHLLLLRDILWSEFKSIFKCRIDICGSLKLLFSCIGV